MLKGNSIRFATYIWYIRSKNGIFNYVLFINYVSPYQMGRHIVLALVSVLPSVCLFVRHTFVSALYLLNPLWDLQITLHICQA